jgi:pilus assembly protein CpaC
VTRRAYCREVLGLIVGTRCKQSGVYNVFKTMAELRRQGSWIGRLTLAAVLVVGTASAALAQNGAAVQRVTGTYAGEVVIPVNKSQIIEVDVAFSRVVVGNPGIADVLPLSDRTLYILGKQIGLTNLSIYAGNNQPLAVVDLSVSHDIQGLKSRLNELLPNENVEVRSANQSLILSGTISGAKQMSRVMTVASQYAPGHVTNMMDVAGSQQVMLEVRFAEVSRSLARKLGLNPLLRFFDGDTAIAFGTTEALALAVAPVAGIVSGIVGVGDSQGFGFGSQQFGNFQVDLLIDFLEGKGVVKTLAEPNLVALSGTTASFLAGGEFPIPVSQDGSGDNSTITVEFQEFGVSLAFTPTVINGDLINLVVAPEVSQIDPQGSISTSGFSIPSLVVRRASTTVELRDGQSFSIAGLLQTDYNDSVEQFPWVGDVPVLGALFRSTEFRRRESELVVIVTPRLVRPVPAGTLATAADNFIPPPDFDLFFHGQIDGRPTPVSGAAISGEGGISGSYGHIVQ